MAIFDAFIGPSGTVGSVNENCERSLNLFAEAIEGGGAGKSRNVLYGTPGLALLITLPQTPVRGLWANENRLFAVGGAKLYEVFYQSGTVSTVGTAVTWVSGTQFDNTNGVAGNTIFINGVKYAVASYTSAIALTLTATAGTQTAKAYIAATYHERGNVGNDGLPVQIFPNGSQLLIISNGAAYLDSGAGPLAVSYAALTGTCNNSGVNVTWVSGDTFSDAMIGASIVITAVGTFTVSDIFSPTAIILTASSGAPAGPNAFACSPLVLASRGAFLDGYFIVGLPSSRQFNISGINAGGTWSGLDFGIKEAYPDHISGILADHEELWLLGTDTTEVWQNTGAAAFPFERIPGGFIQHGCIATWSPVRLNEGVAWLSSDPVRGGTVAYLAQGFVAKRISTHAVETAWAGYAAVADAVSSTYTERGHEVWLIHFPTANATWAFDATAGWWHERGWWNGATIDRQRQSSHAYVFAQHVVGDWSNGKIYRQSLALLDDDGTSIHRIRTSPHLSTEQLWSFYSRFQLDMEVGLSITVPGVTLEWSDDGGHTFSTPRTATADDATYAGRIVWRRLGKSRDRVFRITITDAVPIALIRAILDVEQGTA